MNLEDEALEALRTGVLRRELSPFCLKVPTDRTESFLEIGREGRVPLEVNKVLEEGGGGGVSVCGDVGELRVSALSAPRPRRRDCVIFLKGDE